MVGSGAELARLPAERITVKRRVILGWLDGPTEAFIQLDRPMSTWRFQIYADAYDLDDLDDRLYVLSPGSDDTIPRLHRGLDLVTEP